MRTYTIPTAFTEEQIDVTFQGDLTLLNTIIGGALAQEPDATGKDRGPLTRWMYYWGQPKATKAEAMAILGVEAPNFVAQIQPGDPNVFFTFIDSLNQSGNNIVRQGGYATLRTVNDDDMAWFDSPGRFVMLTSIGGDVEGMPIWFQIDPTAEVPVGIPGRTYIDENEEEQVHTWTSWKGPNQEIAERDGNFYLAAIYQEQYLKPSVWVPLMLAGSLVVLTKDQFVSLPQPEPE